MNPISNIWKHPKTSAAGVLIAVITVAGLLSQPGVMPKQAGASNVVTLVSALATVLLGLLARDPEPPQKEGAGSSAGDRLGAWMLIVLLLPLPWLSGCSGTSVAQDIVNWTPALQSAVATVDSTAALLAPADAPVFSAATIGFSAASTVLANQARAYLANPSASTLAQLQTQVTTFAQQVNAALLAAAKVVSPASQQQALAAVQGVATIVSAILALVQSISSKSAVAGMAAASVIKLAAVAPYLDNARAAQMVAAHYREPIAQAEVQVAFAEQSQSAAGF